MNSDFVDLLRLFAAHKVRYLIVGGYAAMRYSQPRFTKDLDVWLEPSIENSKNLLAAFRDFGMPMMHDLYAFCGNLHDQTHQSLMISCNKV